MSCPSNTQITVSAKPFGIDAVLCVFDGHGKFGEVVSDVAGRVLTKILLEKLGSCEILNGVENIGDLEDKGRIQALRTVMEDTFASVQAVVEALTVQTLNAGSLANSNSNSNTTALDARESGTTATVVLKGSHRGLTDGKPKTWLLVGHIGDAK